MKNKKAQVTEATIIIVALLIGSQAIYLSYLHQASTVKAIAVPTESLNFFSGLDKKDIIHRESGKLAITQAYADVLAKPANPTNPINCKIVSDKLVIVWNEICKPDNNKIKEDFSKGLGMWFTKISGKEKFKITVGDNVITFTHSDAINELYATTEIFKYKVSHQPSPPFSLNYPNLDLESIHSAVISRKRSCTSNNTISESCMRLLKIEGWTTSMVSGDYLVFTLKSDKSYFYDSSFKPTEIRFALQKLS